VWQNPRVAEAVTPGHLGEQRSNGLSNNAAAQTRDILKASLQVPVIVHVGKLFGCTHESAQHHHSPEVPTIPRRRRCRDSFPRVPPKRRRNTGNIVSVPDAALSSILFTGLGVTHLDTTNCLIPCSGASFCLWVRNLQ
ncbi:hypothetical protein XELAEV_18041448mg, partial [Xenopus laevis]